MTDVVSVPDFYLEALRAAEFLFEVGVEPTSALKQGGSDAGVPWGEPMGAFVAWGLTQWGVAQ
jgi:hypothetical protein